MKNVILASIIAFIALGCSSVKLSDNSLFFQGYPSSECKYLGYISSNYTGETPNDGFLGSKRQLQVQAQKYNSNAIKIVNYNMAVNTFKLSAELYYCVDTSKMKKDLNESFFNLDEVN